MRGREGGLLLPGVHLLLRRGHQARVGHQDPRAGVPAEDGAVVAGGPDLGGLLEMAHRLLEPVIGYIAGVQAAALELGLGPALADDAGVIVPAVLVRDLGEELPRLLQAGARA